jgi:V-type H+-transporting ATPase subunit D
MNVLHPIERVQPLKFSDSRDKYIIHCSITMSSSGQRPPANRMMLQQFKARLVGAKKGFQLLKKKRDALKSRFQQMLREIVETKRAVGEGMRETAFSLAKAKWASGGDITQSIIQRVKRPSATVKLNAENVAGVLLPIFDLTRDPTKDQTLLSLGAGQGGQVIQSARSEHVRVLELLVKMASLQTCFLALDEEIKMTSRRVNALDYVVIPRIEIIVKYIEQEMDEMEREEFFRIKKVVEKKKGKILKDLAERKFIGTQIESNGGTAFDDLARDPDLVF